MDCLDCFWINLVKKRHLSNVKGFCLGNTISYHIVLLVVYVPTTISIWIREGHHSFLGKVSCKKLEKKILAKKAFWNCTWFSYLLSFFLWHKCQLPILTAHWLFGKIYPLCICKKSANPLKILLFQYCAVHTLEKNQCNFSKFKLFLKFHVTEIYKPKIFFFFKFKAYRCNHGVRVTSCNNFNLYQNKKGFEVLLIQ